MARKRIKAVRRNDYPEPYYYAPENLTQQEREELTLLNLILRTDKNRKDKFVELNICNAEMWRDACIKDKVKKIASRLKRAGFIKSYKLKNQYTQVGNDCVHRFEETGNKEIQVQIYKMEKGQNYKRALPLIKAKCLPYLNSIPNGEQPYFYANFEKGYVLHNNKKFVPKSNGYRMHLLHAFIIAGPQGLSIREILKTSGQANRKELNENEHQKEKRLIQTVRKLIDDLKTEWIMANLKEPLFERTINGYRFILPQQYIRQSNLKA